MADSSQATLGAELTRAIAPPDRAERSLRIELSDGPHLLFYKQLNPNSLFPPAYEICIYPLNDLLARQRQLRWQILGAGALLLLAAFAVSHFASARLSVPVAKLARDSAEDRAERERAEAALEKTSKELQRSARFSANTSHQLKTPVTVLRAGLEELREHENLTPEGREEIAALIHQTFRITSIIEDLLLLSQMDAGRLQITFTSVDLSHLLEAQMDDLSALPDGADVEVESDCGDIHIAGEKHYVALILQNLLENARKYNRPGGRIRISCREEGEWAVLTIGNTGRSVPRPAREHIFERFHRGSMGEDVPGHGLGLNLARELARLHGGDLRLVSFEGRLDGIRSALPSGETTCRYRKEIRMRTLRVASFCFFAFLGRALAIDDFLDRLGETLTITAFDDRVRAQLRGTLDFEIYHLDGPAPSLIFTNNDFLLNPRLSLFLDAQLGPQVYVFAQGRVDRGFDPNEGEVEARFDEYAVRVSPWQDGRFSFQLGKFATVVGNWVARHHSWDNPFVTAPLPYENLTAIWDSVAAPSSTVLLGWAHVQEKGRRH